jgi:uncharacterized protein (TIGR00251 family)
MSDVTITVRVQPRASSRGIVKGSDGVYKIRTTVAPEKGKANDDVVDILAEHFGVPKSAVALVRGGSGRRKIFKIMAL